MQPHVQGLGDRPGRADVRQVQKSLVLSGPMSPIEFILCGLAVVLSTASVDYAHAKHIRALEARARHKAAQWSVAQWLASALGFILIVKVSVYLLPFEACGLYLGSWYGARP